MNNYQLNDEIGKGAYSIVYKGRMRSSTDYFAISSIEKERRPEVLNSVQTLRLLRHPSIIEFHNWYETNNHLWVITELCIGGDLRSILSVEKKLNAAAVQAYGRDVARGLMFIHSKGILCNSLKPSNLLMDAAASLRYYDFSIACPFTNAASRPVVGTALYMAPELFLFGRGVTSMASDLWALGCLLYEMASGSPAFTGTRLEDVVRAVMTASAPVVREMPASFNALVAALLHKDPLQRATWSQVTASAFWEGTLSSNVPSFPAEPAFAAYRQHRGKEWATTADIEAAIRQAAEAARMNLTNAGHVGDEADLDEPPVDKEVNFTPSPGVLLANAPSQTAHSSDHVNGGRAGGSRDSTAQLGSSLPDNRSKLTTGRRGGSVANKENLAADLSRSDVAGPNRRSVGRSKNAKPTAQYRSRSTGRREGERNSDASGAAAAAAAGDDRYTLAQLEAFNKGALSGLGLENLLWQALDPHVRPLCMNNRIEHYVKPKFEPKTLGFQAVALAELKTWSPEALTKYATTAYRSISSSSTSFDEKLNILNYFETISVDPSTANILVNSSMMTLCLKLAGTKQASPTFRAAAASIMGMLVRHTTFIHADLAKSGIVDEVVNLLETETSTRVKRKLISCLGEFVFYVAVQSEAERTDWVFSSTNLQRVYLSTLQGSDDILKHYAAKTVENLASVRDRYMVQSLFCTPRFVELLLTLGAARVTPTCTEHMRSTAICAALKLAIVSESLMPIVFRSDSVPMSSYVSILQSAPIPHTTQILLTFLNFALVKALVKVNNDFTTMWNKRADKGSAFPQVFASSELSTSEADAILGDLSDMSDDILAGLSEGSEHSTAPTHGKTLLFVVLINCPKASPLPRLCTQHILGFLDRLLRETDPYVVECGNALCAVLSEFVSEKLAATVKRVSAATPLLLQALQQLLRTTTVRSRLSLQSDVFANLGECIEKCLSSSLYGAYEDDFNAVAECIVMDAEMSLRYASQVCTHVVTPYLQMVSRRQSHRRFTAVRILGGFVASVTADNRPNLARRDSTAINEAITKIAETLSRSLSSLLTESPPVPSRTLNLLALCGRARPIAVSGLATTETVDLLLGFLSSSPETDTQNAMELLLLCMQQCGSSQDDLVTHAVSHNLPSLLSTIVTNAAADQLDDLLEASCTLAAFVLRKATVDPSSRAATQCLPLLEKENVSRVFLPLCAKCGVSGESASSVVNELCHLSSTAQADLLSDKGLTHAKAALKANRDSAVFPECTQAATEYLLEALRYACENTRKSDLQRVAHDADLAVTVKSLTSTTLPRSITSEAARLLKLLKG